MEKQQIRKIIRQELPIILNQDSEFRDWVRDLMQSRYADKIETESRFDRMLEELRRDREDNNRKWEENNRKWEEQNRKLEEQNRKWEDNNRKWEDNNRKWEDNNRKWEDNNQKWKDNNQKWKDNNRKWEDNNRKWEDNTARIDRILDNIEAMSQKHESSIGALGARWGLRTEESFRSGLKGILETSFGVEVINVVEFDDEGEVFGRPDQVEIDVIIHNGVLILCELKSSMSKSDMYIFDRKVGFYEKHHHRKADRKLAISPMVDPKAEVVAKKLGIEVYSYADKVPVKKVRKTAKKKKG